MRKGDVAINRFGKRIWSLKDHSDMLPHFIDIDIWAINVNTFIPDLTSDLSNVNRIIHPIQAAKIG